MDALLLRHAGAPDVDDRALISQIERLAESLAHARIGVHRALSTPTTYAYFESADADRSALERAARSLPAFSNGSLTVDRLERKLEPRAASAGEPAPFFYVVETEAAPGWDDEIARWYDDEHMPGLASVKGCVRAQRFVNRDSGPWSHACYDLVAAEVLSSPSWLAVRATAWSDRVRPQFRNTTRTMFRSVPTTAPSAR